MPSALRMKRINDRFKEVLSIILLTKTEDPRLAEVIVTDVKVDRELDYANIYVSSPEGVEKSKEIIAGLIHASGFLKYELANEIDLRVMPKLRFFWDPTPERANRIDTIIAQLHSEDPGQLRDKEDKFSEEEDCAHE
ncbi:MAG: 30S ribosome-binding factor RbfA [Anaerolineaceae bacterium]|jgi:ribosome-binding factor A